jgi:hypothetical protein
MTQWEYLTLDLSDLPKRANLPETLNAAGRNGWEMIAITLNNIVMLKRKCVSKESSKPALKDRPAAKDSRPQNSRVP